MLNNSALLSRMLHANTLISGTFQQGCRKTSLQSKRAWSTKKTQLYSQGVYFSNGNEKCYTEGALGCITDVTIQPHAGRKATVKTSKHFYLYTLSAWAWSIIAREIIYLLLLHCVRGCLESLTWRDTGLCWRTDVETASYCTAAAWGTR